jgi:hypothetical protein
MSVAPQKAAERIRGFSAIRAFVTSQWYNLDL